MGCLAWDDLAGPCVDVRDWLCADDGESEDVPGEVDRSPRDLRGEVSNWRREFDAYVGVAVGVGLRDDELRRKVGVLLDRRPLMAFFFSNARSVWISGFTACSQLSSSPDASSLEAGLGAP